MGKQRPESCILLLRYGLHMCNIVRSAPGRSTVIDITDRRRGWWLACGWATGRCGSHDLVGWAWHCLHLLFCLFCPGKFISFPQIGTTPITPTTAIKTAAIHDSTHSAAVACLLCLHL